ncbi:peptide MFS transporter [Aquimarina litoralis]|uniref:Peptide MFS transporter n=1 Tax=Aquimarina litoralis TaxID=584605 RepID=A0ABN1ILX7_9FLAO
MDFTLILLIVAWAFCLVWVPMTIVANRKSHPKALFVLFFAEMWERFSYYGMRALLTLYMAKVMFKALGDGADLKAVAVYGSYTALVYLFPVIGGLIADKYFGFRRAIIFGGVLMMLGHFALAMEGLVFEGNELLFYLSLSLIIVGNGYFKPNVSSFLGEFYEEEKYKLQKDGAYNIFYMGINVGAFLSALTCGYLGEKVGWHYGFGLAGVGMFFGLMTFYMNRNVFGERGVVKEAGVKKVFSGISLNVVILIATVVFVPLTASLLSFNEVLEIILLVAGIGILAGLIIYGAISKERVEGTRLWVVVVLAAFNIFFWALFEQAGGSLTLFTDKNVDRVLFGSEIPASAFQSLNAFFIITLATAFTWMWSKLRKRNLEPSTPMKFVLGLVQLAIGFGVIVLGANMFSTDGLVPMIFIVLMYFFHTTGELSLSPVGLSMVSKLSPAKIVGFVMGVWFVSFALANKLAGKIGEWAASEKLPENAQLQDTLDIYSTTYLNWGVYVVLGAAAILLLLVPLLRKWMGGIH